MLEAVKLAMRISTTAYDDELNILIEAAKADLCKTADIEEDLVLDTDPLIKRAVITYCRLHFGSPNDYDKLAESYKEQKAQLATSSSYTDWGED